MIPTLTIIGCLCVPTLVAWLYFVKRAKQLKEQNTAIYNQSEEVRDSGSELMIFM